MSLGHFVEVLRQRTLDRRKTNHAEMDKGKPPDQYHQLVGRNKELKELLGFINEEAEKLLLEEDEL